MTLFSEVTGDSDKPALVLMHGWGMHSAVWHSWLPSLTPHFRLLAIDLPGMGRSAGIRPEHWSVEQLAEMVQQQLGPRLQGPALWLGWSLGGIVAMELARSRPQLVRGVITVASNPCFVQQDNYPSGMPAETFASFGEELRQDWQKTLNRFVMLMAQGSQQPKHVIRQLKSVLSLYRQCPPTGLVPALELLNRDYRALFGAVECPRLHLLAESDALVPAAVVDQPALTGCGEIVSDCSHLPFLDQPEAMAARIVDFHEELADA